ncbi:MAG: hypothetical protein VZR09_09975 [Candidatus Gastranaerophilaceae bacterium]|nr:hypothetical protein [Candidatus Gastranaerophilaceae bacterium]
MNNTYIYIKRIAEIKGLKSTRSIRIAIQKGKYIAREIKVNGGTSYEILYSSLEPEIQERIFGRAMLSDSEQARKVPVGRFTSHKNIHWMFLFGRVPAPRIIQDGCV